MVGAAQGRSGRAVKAYELPIAGAWVFEPTVFPDQRGMFAAPF